MSKQARRHIRREGWTARKIGPDRWRVSQLGDVREMTCAELLDFAGMGTHDATLHPAS